MGALHSTIDWYARLGIRFKAVLTDNGPAYRSLQFAQVCRQLGLKHRFTRPYTPRTNGKAERFIQTALREWAYACSYDNSDQRSHQLHSWLHDYNWHRPHASLNHQPPISRSGFDRNNLLSLPPPEVCWEGSCPARIPPVPTCNSDGVPLWIDRQEGGMREGVVAY